jgi:hypothetical protein
LAASIQKQPEQQRLECTAHCKRCNSLRFLHLREYHRKQPVVYNLYHVCHTDESSRFERTTEASLNCWCKYQICLQIWRCEVPLLALPSLASFSWLPKSAVTATCFRHQRQSVVCCYCIVPRSTHVRGISQSYGTDEICLFMLIWQRSSTREQNENSCNPAGISCGDNTTQVYSVRKSLVPSSKMSHVW